LASRSLANVSVGSVTEAAERGAPDAGVAACPSATGRSPSGAAGVADGVSADVSIDVVAADTGPAGSARRRAARAVPPPAR